MSLNSRKISKVESKLVCAYAARNAELAVMDGFVRVYNRDRVIAHITRASLIITFNSLFNLLFF